MTKNMKIMGVLLLYFAIFAWMSVPFVTTDKAMMRKQVMFIDNLQEQIVADNTQVAFN